MKILIYPYDKNPYQTLLYNAMKQKYDKKVRITYLWFLPFVGALHIPLELLLRRIVGYQLIHIHWVAFYIRQNIPRKQLISWYTTMFNLWWIKKLGYKVVWTVHDITPHQQETSDDIDISQRLASMANLKIIHSRFTREQMMARGLDVSKCVTIPHGNYDGVYVNEISPSEARKKLNLPSNKLVIMFFGNIKKYKGVDDLLRAYQKIRTAETILVIAGQCSDDSLESLLLNSSRQNDIIIFNKYIPEQEVATFFKACNTVCLPFKAITTSGSIILALTFGKPVIAPSSGALKEFPRNIGYLYDSNDTMALENALRNCINNPRKLKGMSSSAKKFSDTLSWERLATETYEQYAKLVGT